MNWPIFKLLLAIVLALSSCSTASGIFEQISLATEISIRNATESDSEAITNILLSAFHDAPDWKYVYQFQDQYPEEHFDCYNRAVHKAFGITGVLTQLALLPNITEPHGLTPVAVAMWILPTAWESENAKAPAFAFFDATILAKCKHRDMNMTRGIDYDRQFDEKKKQCLDDVYPKRDQLYLNALATHPDYQRHGAGSALVRSGVAIGKAAYKHDNVTATLIASQAGEPLYQYLMWESIHNFTVQSLEQVNNTRKYFSFDVMKHQLD